MRVSPYGLDDTIQPVAGTVFDTTVIVIQLYSQAFHNMVGKPRFIRRSPAMMSWSWGK